MSYMPCTRGLSHFEKTGCPQREYNPEDGTGCPLWIEMEVPTRENPLVKKKYKKCVDLWYFTFQWSMLGLLEGNQQATESFRNAMVEVNPDNPEQTRPKSVNVVLEVIQKTLPSMLGGPGGNIPLIR